MPRRGGKAGGARQFEEEKMVGGGGFFGSRRGFLRYDSGWTKGKYRDGLRKVSRYFVKTIAILFAKYRDTLSCSKAKRIKGRLGLDQRKSGVRPFLAGGRGRFLRRVVESWRGICYNMRHSSWRRDNEEDRDCCDGCCVCAWC